MKETSTSAPAPDKPVEKPVEKTTLFLNLSLAVEFETSMPLDRCMEHVSSQIEWALSHRKATVISNTWDRDQAKAFILSQARERAPEIVGRQPKSPSNANGCIFPPSVEVATVLEKYNLTLPKGKRGQPEWRVPKGTCMGSVAGIPDMVGEMVLTNGIMAFLVMDWHNGEGASQRCKWHMIHHDWFKPVDEEAAEMMPDGIAQPKVPKSRLKMDEKGMEEEKKVKELFAGF